MWAFTACSVTPSSCAITFDVAPSQTRSRTSRSRGVILTTVASYPRGLPSLAQRPLDLFEVLAAVRRAQRVERAVRVGGPGAGGVRRRERRHTPVRLLRDPQRDIRRLAGRDRVEERAGRVVDPIDILGLGVAG